MKKYLLTPIFLVLFCSGAWGYDIIVGGVTVYNRQVVSATVGVYLLDSGVTKHFKEISGRINRTNPTWKVLLRDELKDEVLSVNTTQMAEDDFQAGVSTFRTWLKGQVE